MGNPFKGPPIPKPAKPPPPPDEVKAMLREMSRSATDRKLRQGKGRTNAFLSLDSPPQGEPYRAPGSKPVLGG